LTPVSGSSAPEDAMSMVRRTCIAILAFLAACAPMKAAKPDRGYAGTVQKAYPVTVQGKDLPGIRLLGRVGNLLAPKLRRSSETNQYVVRISTGQIMAQSDEEFSVGECVEVVPQGDAAGPAYPRGQANVVKSNSCTTLAGDPQTGN
jgi:hypothetical protein